MRGHDLIIELPRERYSDELRSFVAAWYFSGIGEGREVSVFDYMILFD
jgi:hypothetical protein